MAPPVIPLVILGVGSYLTWFGVHYWDSSTKWPSDPVKDVLTGKGIPAATGQTSASTVAARVIATSTSASGSGSAAAGGSVATGSQIANDAEKYIGEGYVYGGPSQPGSWDCSSFASYVLGHDLGLPLPGGSWASVTDNGKSHGPASGSYMLFGTGIPYGSEQPGDILATTEHMGFVIGGGKMMSAQDEELGTNISGYTSGFPGGQPVVRRVST